MENVERRETYLGMTGPRYRSAAEVFLQCKHYGTNNVEISPDDTVRAQGGRGQEEPQVFQDAVHMNHCDNKGGTNVGRRLTLQ